MSESKNIDARPTKLFFITMLTRDINLLDAILDLVDNSVDGAKKNYDGDFKERWIKIVANSEQFAIKDNCGGFTSKEAREHAFRFGRPSEVESIPNSVGLFGVGMKRAIFKIGRNFYLESKNKKDHFIVEEDINEWKKDDENWDFGLNEVTDGNLDEKGVFLKINKLLKSVSEDFDNDLFINDLMLKIKETHLESINKGLKIMLNDVWVETKEFHLLESDELHPGSKTITLEKNSASPININIITGIGERDPNKAGWYLFCNGRLILEADQSFLTGWGDGTGNSIPKYHNDYAWFRGFVYLESKDPNKLPWNTTKTGVDAYSPVYRKVRFEMLSQMRQVMKFLKELRKEKSNAEDLPQTPLQDTIQDSKSVSIKEIEYGKSFTYPEPEKITKKDKNGRISYSRPNEKIKKLKKLLGLKHNKEVGEYSFDYFYEQEVGE